MSMSSTTAPGAGARSSHWSMIGRFLLPHRRALTGFALLVLVAGLLPLLGPLLLGAIADAAGRASRLAPTWSSASTADARRLTLLNTVDASRAID